MSTTVSAYVVTAVGITVLTIGGFIGLVYKSTDSHNGNTTDSGAASQDQTTFNESEADTGVNSRNQITLNDKLKEHIEDMVKSEIEKYRKKSEETHDLQIYKKGEVEQVLTPELLNEVIEDKVTQVFDKYVGNLKDKIENLEKKLVPKNEDRQISKTAKNDYLERLQKLESIMQEKEKDSNPGVKYVESIYDILSLTASRIEELYNIALSQAYSSLPNITSEALIEYSQQNTSAGQSVVVTTTVLFISGILELCCCVCICKRCCRRNRDPDSKSSTNNSSASSKTGPSSPSSEKELKIAYKKLDDSLCVISFSKEYVTTYHLPLARSLTEYMSLGKLRNMKNVIITKPENLNSIPRSRVFIVCVDYNERNDILEPDTTSKNTFLVRRSTVRSLMDSEALVILVYCLEKSSENLSVSDRYAHKLHSKIVAVEETRELDKKNCIFSVYKKFSVFQLGAMKQTVIEFLKKVEEIVSR